MGFVDLHSHILPATDDGAENLGESLIMARQAVAQGTSILAATPHRWYRGREQQGAMVAEAVERLQRSLDRHAIPLKLVPGVELPLTADTADMLNREIVMPLGGPDGRYALIELPFETIAPDALSILAAVMQLRITPVIAHPERNRVIQKSTSFIAECASLGMVLQVTAGSLLGKFGAAARSCAEDIVREREWRVIIASDAHNAYERPTSDLQPAMAAAAEILGDGAAAQSMVDDVPSSLLPS